MVILDLVTSWARALKAARRTQGLEDTGKEPSRSWVAKMLLAEHSPIRLVEYEWVWSSIKQWITVHLVRHHIGCEKFVHSQREDRRDLEVPRDELPQGAENDMMMTANAQALINISRKRLCSCASPETRAKWQEVKDAIAEKDPVMATRMVPECQYRGFCPEFAKNNCGYFLSDAYVKQRLDYCSKMKNQEWRKIFNYNYISNNGIVITPEMYDSLEDGTYIYFNDSPFTYKYINGTIRVDFGYGQPAHVGMLMCNAFGRRYCHPKNRNIFDLDIDNMSDDM